MFFFVAACLSFLSPHPGSAFASSSAFDFGAAAIRGIREIRDLAVAPVEFKHEAGLARLRSELAARRAEKEACATFECAEDKGKLVRRAEADLEIAELARQEELVKTELPYELEVRELLVQVYFLTLLEELSAHPRVRHLLNRGTGPCGAIATPRAKYLPLASPHVCRQLSLDFKLGENFLRVSLAAGTVRKHFNRDGKFEPVHSSVGLEEGERILLTPGWLRRQADPERILAEAKPRVSLFRDGKYMLGGTSEIGFIVTSVEQR